MSDRHGLSVYTTADADPNADTTNNRRLRRPVAAIISNTFNDATSGKEYDQRAGHEGIDFACGSRIPVRAMYGGEVVKVKNDWESGLGLGNFVILRSYTDADAGTGFEHTYAHLESSTLKPGQSIAKGDQIGLSGLSGLSGTQKAHLHVHLRAFGANGTVTKEYDPAEKKQVGKKKDWKPITELARRIDGCMNYACFLPPDNTQAPAIDRNALRHTGKLLSLRDAYASIPVYKEIFQADGVSLRDEDARISSDNRHGSITGAELGCYAVLEAYSATSPEVQWYKIQYRVGVTGWVSQSGPVTSFEVTWVQVEDAPDTLPEALVAPYFVMAKASNINVRKYPNADQSGGAPIRGQLALGRHYPVQGTFWDPRTEKLPKGARRWWQIDFDGQPGWVRSDVVLAHVDLNALPLTWSAAPRNLHARSLGAAVRLDWSSPWSHPDIPARMDVTGYRIWRYQDPSVLSTQGNTTVFDVPATPFHWTDSTAGAAVSPHSLLYYRIAVKVGSAVGAVSGYVSVAVIGQPAAPHQPDPMPDAATSVPVAPWHGNYPMTYNPGGPSLSTDGVLAQTTYYPAIAVLAPSGFGGARRDVWLRIQKPRTGAPVTALARSARSTATQSPHVEGWAREAALQGTGAWQEQVATLPAPPYARAPVPHPVPVRIGPSLGYTEYVTQITRMGGWYGIIGRHDDWWQLRINATTQGWVQASQVEETGDRSDVPFVQESPPPALPGPAGGDAPAAATTQASGPYHNMANSWQGAWAVSKRGTTVTAAFQSTRSPVQWYARQNPQDLAVLPAGFRPITTQDIQVTGVHVTVTGEDYARSPRQQFTLRVAPTGQVRYVDGRELDHVGYLRYEMGTPTSGRTITWQTSTAATVPTRRSQANLTQRGNFLNRAVHKDGYWNLVRRGNAVTGVIGSAKSAVQYAARQHLQDLFRLPVDYRPRAKEEIKVTGTHVHVDGTDFAGAPTQTFTLRISPHGVAQYVDGPELHHVGYLRYSVSVSWTAVPRVQVPAAPRDLEAENVQATMVELDWRSPVDDGGSAIQGYRVEIYRRGHWRTVEADTDSTRTRHDVEDLASYTRYSFRVAARNRIGWGPFSTAVSVTTRREAPGQPRSLAAAATHAQVTLDWRAPAAGGRVTGYRVERRVDRGGYRMMTANTGNAVRFYVDRDIRPATTYFYRVRALHYGTEGAWSATTRITTAAAPTIPGAPTGLSVEPGEDSQLQLAWTAPLDTGGGVTGYRVERAPDATPRAWTEVVATSGSAARVWHESRLAADTVYRYRVSARNGAGTSSPSVEAQGRTRPQLKLDRPVAYPLNIHAEPRPNAAVTATLAFFLPERTLDIVGQVPGTDGWWRVLLFGQNSPGPCWLPAAAGTAAGSTATVPQTPGLRPGAVGSGMVRMSGNQVELTWRAPVAPGSHPVRHYRVRQRQASHGETYIVVAPRVAATRWTGPAPTAPGTWYYAVQAVSAAGAGPWSNPGPSRHVLVVGTPPGPVGAGTVRMSGSQVELTWRAPAAPGSHPVRHYRVRQRRASHGEAYIIVASRVTDTRWTGPAPTAPGTWYYAVQVVSVAGVSSWSNPESSRHVLVVPSP